MSVPMVWGVPGMLGAHRGIEVCAWGLGVHGMSCGCAGKCPCQCEVHGSLTACTGV